MNCREAQIEVDLEAEARRLLALIDEAGLAARLIGGMAIRLLAAGRLHPAFERPIADLDFIIRKRTRGEFDALLIGAGYVADESFNTLNGARRLLYHDESYGRQIDVFVESFDMCHTLPLTDRIETSPQTLPPAEILMTKLQIAHLNVKDRGDLYALLHSHEVGDHDEQTLNCARITELTANDWGLQHTLELNLQRLRDGLAEQPIDSDDMVTIRHNVDALAIRISEAPKSRKWKLRAKVGERKRWYEEPEEVDREP